VLLKPGFRERLVEWRKKAERGGAFNVLVLKALASKVPLREELSRKGAKAQDAKAQRKPLETR